MMKRLRQTQIVEEVPMSHLHELANRMSEVGRPIVFAKRKMGNLRAVSRRMQAVHETSTPIIAQKLNRIHRES